jgi:hypothetical protein
MRLVVHASCCFANWPLINRETNLQFKTLQFTLQYLSPIQSFFGKYSPIQSPPRLDAIPSLLSSRAPCRTRLPAASVPVRYSCRTDPMRLCSGSPGIHRTASPAVRGRDHHCWSRAPLASWLLPEFFGKGPAGGFWWRDLRHELHGLCLLSLEQAFGGQHQVKVHGT